MERRCNNCNKDYVAKKATQQFCCRPCSLAFRNKFENPAKKKEVRIKMSIFAKARGTAHLNTIEAKLKQKKTITGKGHWNWQGGKSHPPCIDCGKLITFKKKRCKRCLGLSLRGENAPNWQGGINPINKTLRNRIEGLNWRKSVFERDNYTCVWCGARSGKGIKVILNADHIKPWAKFPQVRYELSNGRTLCLKCHKKRHSKEQALDPDFSLVFLAEELKKGNGKIWSCYPSGES